MRLLTAVSLVRVQQGEFWLHGQAVKTPPFHGGNRGSIPLGVTKRISNSQFGCCLSCINTKFLPERLSLIRVCQGEISACFSRMIYTRMENSALETLGRVGGFLLSFKLQFSAGYNKKIRTFSSVG